MTCHTSTWPEQDEHAQDERQRHMAVAWVHSRLRRLGSASAARPPNSPRTITGRNCAAATSAQRDRVVGQLQHQPVLGDRLHPGARRARPAGPGRTAGSCDAGRPAARPAGGRSGSGRGAGHAAAPVTGAVGPAGTPPGRGGGPPVSMRSTVDLDAHRPGVDGQVVAVRVEPVLAEQAPDVLRAPGVHASGTAPAATPRRAACRPGSPRPG